MRKNPLNLIPLEGESINLLTGSPAVKSTFNPTTPTKSNLSMSFESPIPLQKAVVINNVNALIKSKKTLINNVSALVKPKVCESLNESVKRKVEDVIEGGEKKIKE